MSKDQRFHDSANHLERPQLIQGTRVYVAESSRLQALLNPAHKDFPLPAGVSVRIPEPKIVTQKVRFRGRRLVVLTSLGNGFHWRFVFGYTLRIS